LLLLILFHRTAQHGLLKIC